MVVKDLEKVLPPSREMGRRYSWGVWHCHREVCLGGRWHRSLQVDGWRKLLKVPFQRCDTGYLLLLLSKSEGLRV